MQGGWSRREFLGQAVASAAVGVASVKTRSEPGLPVERRQIPPFLTGYEAQWEKDPRAATLQWFQDAGFGLFMHYGLYSLLGRHEWVMYRENIPVAEYEALRHQFTAARFDADAITDMALDAGMRYVTITTRHHEGFCLFESAVSHYNAARAAAGRDLIAELAEQCEKKRLGLFFYYSYALDWWHPYFYPREFISVARPEYDPPEPRYLWRRDEDFAPYVRYVHAQIEELLTHYGSIAGMWFDPIMGYYARPDLFPIDETYALVRRLQPHALISFKQGASGEEDFVAPERSAHSLEDRVRQRLGDRAAEVAAAAWRGNQGKPTELCNTLQPGGWGHVAAADGRHRTAAQVMEMLESAAADGHNLLLNTGPLGDGSIHAEDRATLAEVGRRRRR